jgi:succinylglutamic semialdehyde dehydrogenase
VIASETGKPLWEAKTEVGAVVNKVQISVDAYAERTGQRRLEAALGNKVAVRHKPHGVLAVLGPYNFPAHLPNGHIVPALLAGNCVVFKPSEHTPAVGERLVDWLGEAGVSNGAIELVQGGRQTGAALLECELDGVLFTGSAATGRMLRRKFADRPDVILALELGGNNPLIAWDGDPEIAADIVVQSAFVTTGQRCSCARRLIVPTGAAGDQIVSAVLARSEQLRIGAWHEADEPFMGPLIVEAAARTALAGEGALVAAGARRLRPMAPIDGRAAAFISPGLLDATGLDLPDEEIFAPLLTVQRAPNFAAALDLANRTRFGLSAGLISDDDRLWEQFLDGTRAGVVNRNRPTTGASGAMPFGGTGESGNHRPSAYYAADYCAYPVASMAADRVVAPARMAGMQR